MSQSYWFSIVCVCVGGGGGVMANSIESNEPELLAFSSSELSVSSDLNWFDFLSWPTTKGHFLM